MYVSGQIHDLQEGVQIIVMDLHSEAGGLGCTAPRSYRMFYIYNYQNQSI